MVDRKQLLNSLSLKPGPSALAGLITRANSRGLVLGASADVSTLPRLNDYFDLVIVENPGLLPHLGLTVPDVVIWPHESCYIDGTFALNHEVGNAFVAIRWESLEELASLGRDTGYVQFGYLPGGEIGTTAALIRSVPSGLSDTAPGVHLAKIAGCQEVYDTDGRSGTIVATNQVLDTMIFTVDKYGISLSWLGSGRPTILERI